MLSVWVLASCGAPRSDHEEPEPAGETGSSPEQPRRSPAGYPVDSADQLVEDARRELRGGRPDEARVSLHLAFRRDRWHPKANRLYQDLMIDEGLFDHLWDEYTDLYLANRDRGDALFWHLRPWLIAGNDSLAGSRPPNRKDVLRRDAVLAEGEGRKALAEEWLKDEPQSVPAHRLSQDLAGADETAELASRYGALAEENPENGDLLSLHARMQARTDRQAGLDTLRQGLLLGLPGYWLRLELAELAVESAEAGGETRQVEGLAELALLLADACLEKAPEDWKAWELRGRACRLLGDETASGLAFERALADLPEDGATAAALRSVWDSR